MTAEDDQKSDWIERLKRQGVPEKKIAVAKSSAARMSEAASGLLFDPRDAIGPETFSILLSELGKAGQ